MNKAEFSAIKMGITFALLAMRCADGMIELDAKGTNLENSVTPAVSSTNVLVMDVDKFGAVGDGVTMNTVAIQSAIKACPADGIVWLHGGTFLSGTISLKGNMTLSIDSTATLLGSGSASDYPVLNAPAVNTQLNACHMALVYAQNCTNVTIAGEGVINGNGRANFTNGYVGTRPAPILTVLCNTVIIQNINVVDSAYWTIVNLQSDNLTISNVTINDEGLAPNRDGLDVVDCWHVLIESCTIDSGDDSICLKSGNPRGVQDVVVQNCTVTSSFLANGLKLGTASVGPFTKILVQDCTIMNTAKAAMSVESVDGSAITDLTFSNINLSGCQNAIFMILGSRDAGVAPGSINGVQYINITGSTLTETDGCPISGTMTNEATYSLKNLLFDNVDINFAGGLNFLPPIPPEYRGQYPENTIWGHLPAYGYYIRHATNVCFTNSSASAALADDRPWIVTDDVSDLAIPLPTLKILSKAGPLVLLWGNGSSLQTATSLNGKYTNLIGASSPYTNTLPNSKARFFRVRQ